MTEDAPNLDLGQRELEKMLSTRELADYFDVSYQTVQKAAQRGSIPGCIRVLGCYFFDPEVSTKKWVPAAVRIKAEGRDLMGATGGQADQVVGGGGGFKKGNTLGVGNRGGRPSRKTEEKYLIKLSSMVTEEEWTAVCVKAIEQAKSGDWRARKWLSDYLMGTPVKRILAEVDVNQRRSFAKAELAATVQALLDVVQQRVGGEVIDAESRSVEGLTGGIDAL